jgi:hypothetical protein
MRLLIYLLALVSGFSAADAARAEVTPASSVAQTAVAAAEALASQEQVAATGPANDFPFESIVTALSDAFITVRVSNPVSRHDQSRE